MRFKALGCSVLAWLAAGAAAQGGQGGFGGGGFGGGFQAGEFGEDSEEFRKQLFLSPSDRTEWTFEARENETVLVKVTSGVFDPAVAIHDDKGNKLAENDDLEPGNQMAQLVFSLPRAGTYKAVVTNYKGTAGGAFEFYARRFLTRELKLNEPASAVLDGRRVWGRIAIPSAGDYAVTVRANAFLSALSLMKPDGEMEHAMRHLDVGFGFMRSRFYASQPGVYYLGTANVENPVIRVSPVVIRDGSIDSKDPVNLEEDQLVDWRVHVKAGDLLEVSIPGDPEDIELLAMTPLRPSGNRQFYTVLQQPTTSARYVVAFINDGRIAFCVRNSTGKKDRCEVQVARTGRPFPASGSASSKLGWFQCELWTFQCKPGEVVKLTSKSATYETNLGLLLPSGNYRTGEPVGRKPERSLAVPVFEPGQYVAFVTGGGVGEYTVTMEVVEPKRLREGASTGEVLVDRPDVWRFTGKEGQDFAFRIASKTLRWRVQVIGPDGTELEDLRVRGTPQDDFFRLKIAKAGDYTVVISSTDRTSGAYSLKWLDLDK